MGQNVISMRVTLSFFEVMMAHFIVQISSISWVFRYFGDKVCNNKIGKRSVRLLE